MMRTMNTRREIRASLALLVIPILLGGCAGTPQRTAIDVEMPQVFTAAGADSLPDRWWEELGDTQLNSLIEAALTGSPTLAAARAKALHSRVRGTGVSVALAGVRRKAWRSTRKT